jgi:dGTPase
MSDVAIYEDAVLAPYAMRSDRSRGRQHAENEHPLRSAFQRDRDRIIHTTAFRRLEYKTQVFVNHEGDYFRTRLTHTMETAQVARTIARALRLNEDLAEAVALAHDLGHTPFGHAGERTLDQLMADQGGFEHNSHSLRIVEVLEHRYPQFVGLNLTWEVREAIVKHSPPYDKPLAGRFASGEAPCLEAQIVDYADAIAYNSHDLDDGLKSGLLALDQLAEIEVWRQITGEIGASCGDLSPRILRYQAVRRLIDLMATDLIVNTRERLQRGGIASIEDIRHAGAPLASFSPALDRKHEELKTFLYENLYRHYRVVRMTVKACRVMRELFEAYMSEPNQLPPHIQARHYSGQESLARVVADYIAGMTDRFVFEEHRKLFDPLERV